jgi:cation diffusion facilitator family transporter
VLNSAKESSARTALVAASLDMVVATVALALAQSAVLVADCLKTGLELAAVLLAWLAIRRISRGDAARYEYGLGKLETLSSFVIAALMGLVFLVIVGNAIRNLISPSHVGGVGVYISLVAQVVLGVFNARIYGRSHKAAKSENSPIMESQAKLFMTRLVGNVFIFLSLALSLSLAAYEWSVYVDPIAALIIGASVLVSAVGVFSSSVYDLLDGTLEEADQLKILRELVQHFDRYEMVHGIRSRRAGNRIFIEIFLEFDPDKRVGAVQRDIDAIRKSIEAEFDNASVSIVLASKGESLDEPVMATAAQAAA